MQPAASLKLSPTSDLCRDLPLGNHKQSLGTKEAARVALRELGALDFTVTVVYEMSSFAKTLRHCIE